MIDQLVSFETAKLAKEKGFEIVCDNGYHPDEGNLFSGSTWMSILRIKSERHTQAPTQTLLQKWLRDNHNIHVEPKVDKIMDTSKFGYWMTVITDGKANKGDLPHYKFDSYENALEEGLQKALKLIET